MTILKTVYILKDDRLVRAATVRIEPDGGLSTRSATGWVPLLSKAALERLGLDPKKALQNPPAEARLRIGENEGGVRVVLEEEYRRWKYRNIPGYHELKEAYEKAVQDSERFQRAFQAMMEDGQNDGVYPPEPEDASLQARFRQLTARYPRAALYLEAEAQLAGSHWADNSGKGAAVKEAMRILEEGGPLEEAREALKKRRPLDLEL